MRLADLFAGRRQLIIYHFMFDPEWEEGCKSCSHAALRAGKIWAAKAEMPGLSVFLREGATICHSYSTYQRGLDPLLTTYTLLDMTPLGTPVAGRADPGLGAASDRYG